MNPIYENELVKLYQGDCKDVMKTIPDASIDLIVTDPPYLCTARGGSGSMGGYWTNESAKRGNIFKENDISPKEYLPEFYRILKDGTHCYIMINNVNLIEMLNTTTECGFKFIKSLIWNKGKQICGRFYMNCFEYILMFRKGASRDINNCSTPDILTIPVNKMKDSEGHNLHDTEKPVALMKILIENSSNKGDTVFEPFAGIGATLVAGYESGRKVIGCELDEKYCNIIPTRFYYTNKNMEQGCLF